MSSVVAGAPPAISRPQGGNLSKSVKALGAVGVAVLITIGVAGVANADSDSDSAHGTTLYGSNSVTYGVSGALCNNQSKTNSFRFWITDVKTGGYLYGPVNTGPLTPNACYPAQAGIDTGPIQVFAESVGSWEYGTNPINPS
jgi:hypothetical protein